MKQKIDAIFKILSSANSAPTTELQYKNEFTLLVAVILSAQATDKSVNLATKELFEKYDTPSKMLELGEDNLKYYIKSIGLFNVKAKNIIETCKIIKYTNKVPDKLEDLLALPGVGRKTANVILNNLYKHPVIAVDTHVFRTAKRLGIAKSKNVKGVEEELQKNIPEIYLKDAHNLLVLHGRYICKAIKPLCEKCIINKFCDYYTQKREEKC